ncbi:hypothetical protein NEOC65_002455 [Neochlamydia sp. AcF65]|nr:hypothetical protein [Neochlamydia sp. AcF65]MBS4171373.1 hypothetical protein [Neochlamydia sp. AcF95]
MREIKILLIENVRFMFKTLVSCLKAILLKGKVVFK